MKDLEFYACSGCCIVTDLAENGDKDYIQGKAHDYFWNGKPNCTGRFTVKSTQRAWEVQNKRPYPISLVDRVKDEFK